jgi:hypothetical protein
MSSLVQSSQVCPNCGGKRSYAVYDNNTHCFKCKTHKNLNRDIPIKRDKSVALKWTGHLPEDYGVHSPDSLAQDFLSLYQLCDRINENDDIISPGIDYGWSKELQRLVFPIYHPTTYQLMCYQARAFSHEPKWLTCSPQYKWGKKYPAFFNFFKKSPMIITEDIISAYTISRCDYRSVALLGCNPSLSLVNLLSSVSMDFIVWLDGDSAGTKGANNLYNKLKFVSEAQILTTSRDPKEYSLLEIKESIEKTARSIK